MSQLKHIMREIISKQPHCQYSTSLNCLRVADYIDVFLFECHRLLHNGATPVIVFDGDPLTSITITVILL